MLALECSAIPLFAGCGLHDGFPRCFQHRGRRGELMFHQSGGCDDSSTANCYLPGEITPGAGDGLSGEMGGCPLYISKSQYEYWKHAQLIIDGIDGHGCTFSLEGPEGSAFHTRSRVFTDSARSERSARLGPKAGGRHQAEAIRAQWRTSRAETVQIAEPGMRGGRSPGRAHRPSADVVIRDGRLECTRDHSLEPGQFRVCHPVKMGSARVVRKVTAVLPDDANEQVEGMGRPVRF